MSPFLRVSRGSGVSRPAARLRLARRPVTARGVLVAWRVLTARRPRAPAGAGVSAGRLGSFGWLEPDEWLPHTDGVTILDQPFDNRCGKFWGDDVPSAALLNVPDLGP
jgi:hypothetical protein